MSKSTKALEQEKYLIAYQKYLGVKTKAAEEAGISYSKIKRWHREKKFQERVLELEDLMFNNLSGRLMLRAMSKSDVLGMFFLKSRHPEIFDDAVRRLKWLKEHGMSDPDAPKAVVINFTKGPVPSRVKKERGEDEDT